MRTTDGGKTWQPLGNAIGFNGERYSFASIHCFDANRWAAVTYGTSFYTLDAGATWNWDSVRVPQVVFRAIAAIPGGSCIAVGNYSGIVQSFDQGVSWSTISPWGGPYAPNYFGLAPVNTTTWVAVGGSTLRPVNPGVIIRSVNGGAAWDTVLFTSRVLTAVSFPTSSIGYAAGDSIYRTSDGGATWSGKSPIPGSVQGMSFRDPDVGTIVCSGGKVFRTRDGAKTWTQQASNTNLDLRAVCFIDTSRGWAVGYRGITLRTTNGGWGPLVSAPEVQREIPQEVCLRQNYPNPFNPATTIAFELPKSSIVRLSVYDMLGREVSVLVNERRDAGVHEEMFDAAGLASGVYFYRLQAGDFVQSRRLLLVR
ncbi:T9SS type A sorting domain-containing protein [bacterium]|nr:T9SS type A sorting domain-containing protein [bacterium]